MNSTERKNETEKNSAKEKDDLISLDELEEMAPPKKNISDLENDPRFGFPKRVKTVGGKGFWRRSEVIEWAQSNLADAAPERICRHLFEEGNARWAWRRGKGGS